MTTIADFRAYALVRSAREKENSIAYEIYHKYFYKAWDNQICLKHYLSSDLNYYYKCLKFHLFRDEAQEKINALTDLWNYFMRV